MTYPRVVIVLDFDNCIVLDEQTREGSEEIKDRAWFAVFPEYSREALDPILEQAKRDIAGGKGDRRDIAERVLSHFGFPATGIADEIDRRCDAFNAMVQKGIQRVPIAPAVRESLDKLSRRFPLYVNTATPRKDALVSLQAMGLAKFFKGIYGRPGTKVGNLREILAVTSAQPLEMLFVDDQPSGWLAAQAVGCRFIGISTARNTLWHRTAQPFPIIKSLAELPGLVTTMTAESP